MRQGEGGQRAKEKDPNKKKKSNFWAQGPCSRWRNVIPFFKISGTTPVLTEIS